MAVPTPVAHWTLYNTVGTVTVIDEINSYEADVSGGTYQVGTGGVFGATGRGNGETGYKNTTANSDRIAWDSTASPGLTVTANEGSMSKWCNAIRDSAANNIIMHVSSTNMQISMFSELTTDGNKPVARWFKPPDSVNIVWDEIAAWDGEWFLYSVTWSASGDRFRFYVNDTLIGEGAYPGDTGSLLTVTPVYGDPDGTAGTYRDNSTSQDFRLWDVELTQSEISELYAAVTPCDPTIPADQLAFMWSIAESKMPCTCSIQKNGVLGWETIITDAPCILTKLAPRRQYDETAQVWVTDEQWSVTISGRTTLPLPGVFNQVRFQVLGMTLESYEFYQSPDDIMTTLECRKV